MEGDNGRDVYDQVDSSNYNGESIQRRAAVSGSTQTDDLDTVDSRVGVIGRLPVRNGACHVISSGSEDCNQDGGLFSNLITMVLPTRRKNEDDSNAGEELSCGAYPPAANSRCVSTQTEESPLSARGIVAQDASHELCCMVIQELALENPIPTPARDDVFEALCCCVCEILDKHSILFNGMLRRFEVTDYRVFTSIANELFEASSDVSSFRITWGRVVSLFAFAVRLAQKYKGVQDEDKLDNVVHYLSNYISRHLLDFVEDNGGWEGLVKQFPLPDSEDKQMKRAMLWSGLCVGLVATMYVSSFLSK